MHIVDASGSAKPSEDIAREPESTIVEEPYYWEAGEASPPLPKLIAHNAHWAATQLFYGVEAIGEMFAQFFGLFNARYEYAAEMQRAMEEEEDAREMREQQERRWRMIQRMQEEERKGSQVASQTTSEQTAVVVAPST